MIPSETAERVWLRWMVSYALGSIALGVPVVVVVAQVHARGAGAGYIAAAATARLLPYVTCSPFAGLVASRHRAGTIMRVSCVLRVACIAVIVVLTTRSAPPVTLVVAIFVLVTTSTPVYPALVAATRAVLPARRLDRATRWLVTIETVAFAIGPAIGGLVLATAGPVVALGVSALMLLVALGIVSSCSGPSPAPRQMTGPGAATLREAVDVLRRADTLPTVGRLVAVNVVAGVVAVLLVPVADEQLAGGDDGYGWLTAAFGAGVLIGLVAGATARGRRLAAKHPTAIASTSAIALASLAATVHLMAAVGAVVVTAAAAILTELHCLGSLLRRVPSPLLAPAFGVVDSLAVGAMLGGSVLGPTLAAIFGHRPALVLVGVAVTAVLRDGSTRPMAPWAASGLAAVEEAVAPGADQAGSDDEDDAEHYLTL